MKKYILLTSLAAVASLAAACSPVGNTGNMNSNMNRANMNSANMNAMNPNNSMNSNNSSIGNSIAKLTTDSPQDFMEAAAASNMTEIEASRLALQKSQNAEIKKFAQMMVTDHTKAGNELKALAGTKKMTMPADVTANKDTIDDLRETAAASFDAAYVEAMVDGHEDTVAAFQEQADKSADAEVKAFAAKTLPTLKMHLEMIRAIQAKMP